MVVLLCILFGCCFFCWLVVVSFRFTLQSCHLLCLLLLWFVSLWKLSLEKHALSILCRALGMILRQEGADKAAAPRTEIRSAKRDIHKQQTRQKRVKVKGAHCQHNWGETRK